MRAGFFQDDTSGARSMTRLVLFVATLTCAGSLVFVTQAMIRTGRDYQKAVDSLAWSTVACGVGYVSKSLGGALSSLVGKMKAPDAQ